MCTGVSLIRIATNHLFTFQIALKIKCVLLLSYQVHNLITIFLVAIRLGETPVHIPNTMVKP